MARCIDREYPEFLHLVDVALSFLCRGDRDREKSCKLGRGILPAPLRDVRGN